LNFGVSFVKFCDFQSKLEYVDEESPLRIFSLSSGFIWSNRFAAAPKHATGSPARSAGALNPTEIYYAAGHPKFYSSLKTTTQADSGPHA